MLLATVDSHFTFRNECMASVFFLQHFRTHIMTALSSDITDEPNITLHDEMSFIEDLYEDFEEWCKENGCKAQKNKIKIDLLKWQEKSKYGLSIGKTTKDSCCNGTKRKPLFNLVLLEDQDE